MDRITCSQCGGELDGEGWCARYCTDEGPELCALSLDPGATYRHRKGGLYALRLHLRREWFQPESFPHYDLQDTKHARALELGAVLLDRREFVEVMRRVRAGLAEKS
jgi:hypothetical protein